MVESPKYNPDRQICFGIDCVPIPERLLLAHAQGKVLFITGAGSSRAANLPGFRGLVLKTYEKLDASTYAVINNTLDGDAIDDVDISGLTPKQGAEVRRFIMRDYDVVLGMLERRIDGVGGRTSQVRQAIAEILSENKPKPTLVHKSLVKLADRGEAITIATTNYDLLLELAASRLKYDVQSYALDAIPRPSHRNEFAGIFHIHGALSGKIGRLTDLIVSDQDFGEFYLRRRSIPDFIYDAARLYHIVLVGYSANDPPMRYLLNAVAADGSRFSDLKERYTFIGGAVPADPVSLEDWKQRGITPIPYSATDDHKALTRTLEQWADFSAINGKPGLIEKELKRIVRATRSNCTDVERDLFDHFIRRVDLNERSRLTKFVSNCGADLGWLNAINSISGERL